MNEGSVVFFFGLFVLVVISFLFFFFKDAARDCNKLCLATLGKTDGSAAAVC